MDGDFKLGVVPTQVAAQGIAVPQEGPKLGVVSSGEAPVLTPPGLGVVLRQPVTLVPAPLASFSSQPSNVPAPDCSRIHELKRTWIASEKRPDSGEVLRNVLSEIYSLLSLPPPAIYRFKSPLAAMLGVRHIAHLHGVEVDHHDTPLHQLSYPISMYLGAVDNEKARSDDLCNELTLALEKPIQPQLNAKFLDSFTDQITGAIGPLNDSSRLFETIPYNVMTWWRGISKSRCWWWPYRSFVVVSDGPELHLDEDGRVHRTDGPAVDFADGYGLYFFRNFNVPERVVMHPESLTVDEIDKETNAEVRRIMIERLGHGNYLQKAGARVVDMDSLTLEGSAPRALLVDRLGEKWLVGTDGSTARVYTMPVQRSARTCREAHQGISGFDETRLIVEA